MTLPTVIPGQVAKLIPRLATDQDGEIVATARGIGRTLKAAGLDFHALASALRTAPEVREVAVNRDSPEPQSWSSWRYARQETTCADIAEWCQNNHRGRLNPKERGFINDMAARHGRPTERQAAWLRAIHAKLIRSENAA